MQPATCCVFPQQQNKEQFRKKKQPDPETNRNQKPKTGHNMVAEILSNYNYVCKPDNNAKKPDEFQNSQISHNQNLYSEYNSQNKPSNPDSALPENSLNFNCSAALKKRLFMT